MPYDPDYYQAHKEAHREYQRRYLAKHPAVVQKRRDKWRAWYRRTRDELRAALGPQVCAICGTTSGTFVLDHDHSVNPRRQYWKPDAYRGWLCATCNTGLGQFKDDSQLLRTAARYVASHRRKVR